VKVRALGLSCRPHQEDFMRFVGPTSILILICATPALADDLPSRKPGLWEVKTSIESRNAPAQVIRQCIDATTDQMMRSTAGPFSQTVCPKREVQRSGNSTTIDSTCTIGGKTATAHAVVTGSFDSAYNMTVTSQGENLPGGKMVMTMDAKWLGPCAADQKPGDIILSNGKTINILEMQKHTPSNVPLPPPR
jgi:hypothetical protein